MDDPNQTDWVWRGESKVFDGIRPTLARDSRWPALAIQERRRIEEAVFSRFFASIYPVVHHSDLCGVNDFRFRHFAQHHGCPTRLVDWTHSAWAAVYFACCDDLEQDGRLYCFNAKALERSADAKWDELGVAIRNDGQRDLMAAIQTPVEQRWITTQYSRAPNVRMKAQMGLFTLAGTTVEDHDKLLQDVLSEPDLLEIRIPSKHKVGLLGHLLAMNTSYVTLQIPKLDQRGAELHSFVKSECEALIPQ